MMRFAEKPEMDDKNLTILKQLQQITELTTKLQECIEKIAELQETCDALKGVFGND